MKHYLEAGSSLFGITVWVKPGKGRAVSQGIVIEITDRELVEDDYFGRVGIRLLDQKRPVLRERLTDVSHRARAPAGSSHWFYGGEATEENKLAIRAAGYLI